MADSLTDFSDHQALVNCAGGEIAAAAHSEMCVWQTPLHVCSPYSAVQIDQLDPSPC